MVELHWKVGWVSVSHVKTGCLVERSLEVKYVIAVRRGVKWLWLRLPPIKILFMDLGWLPRNDFLTCNNNLVLIQILQQNNSILNFHNSTSSFILDVMVQRGGGYFMIVIHRGKATSWLLMHFCISIQILLRLP